MNILLSMPHDGQSNFYIIDALRDLGHEVFFIDHRHDMKNCLNAIPQIMEHIKIDLFLCLYLVPSKTYSADVIRQLKVRFPQTKYVSWLFDATIDNILAPDNKALIDIIKEYDYFLTVADGQVKQFRDNNVNAYWVQEGASMFTWALPRKDKRFDISFIGQIGHPKIHTDRLPLLEKIIDNYDKTVIYGPFYKVDSEKIMSHHSGRPTYDDVEHALIVSNSKINLSHSGWSDINHYMSARTYRLMANEGFVLANRTNGIEDIFIENKEIVLYNSIEECLDKIRYYLVHDTEREKIALAGNSKVLDNYTFHHSISKMFKIMKDNK